MKKNRLKSPPWCAERFVVVFLLITMLMSDQCCAFNILILHPVFAGSHEMTLRSLGEQLVSRGHSVTQVRWLNNKSARNIDSSVHILSRTVNTTAVPSARSDYFDEEGVFQIPTDLLWQRSRRLDRVPTNVFSLTHGHCHSTLADQTLLEELRKRDFHLALVDVIANECGLALAEVLKLPVVGFWGFSFYGGESFLTSSVNSPAVTATFLSDLPPEMTFSQRLYNTMTTITHKLLMYRQVSIADHYIQKYHPGLPSASQLVKDINVILVFSNFFVSQPLLLPPNVQMIGCPQCRKARSLKQDQEQFMASSGEHGVVLFSLGITGYEAHSVPDDYIQLFLAAFSRLQQKVIMRFSADRLSNMHVPENVQVVEWFDQIDLLGHPKTKVFISHCGMNGVMESVYHGVPILGVPIFGDQGDNSKFIHYRKLGIGLDKFGLTEDLVLHSLNQLIYNETYRDNVRRTSDAWRAQSETSMERALYWVDIVARFAPLTHLRMIDDHLSWYQFWMLDVGAFLLISGILIQILFWKLVLVCFRRLFRKSDNSRNIDVVKKQS